LTIPQLINNLKYNKESYYSFDISDEDLKKIVNSFAEVEVISSVQELLELKGRNIDLIIVQSAYGVLDEAKEGELLKKLRDRRECGTKFLLVFKGEIRVEWIKFFENAHLNKYTPDNKIIVIPDKKPPKKIKLKFKYMYEKKCEVISCFISGISFLLLSFVFIYSTLNTRSKFWRFVFLGITFINLAFGFVFTKYVKNLNDYLIIKCKEFIDEEKPKK
jgi:hypothetical protein